jgi:hypothetical protein
MRGAALERTGVDRCMGEIWSANVPSKVRIFAWRLSQDELATQVNWKMRTLEKDAICQVCGREDESGHHAVIRCTKAAALRHEMRKHWMLPGEHQFQKVGPDWFLMLLSVLDKETKAKTLLLLWRAWFLMNDIMHGDGSTTVPGSAKFLKSYAISLNCTGQTMQGASDKGKRIVHEGVRTRKELEEDGPEKVQPKWTVPPEGWIKLNTDAGYHPDMGEASTGVVVRDNHGKVLLSAWRSLRNVASVKEAEGEACLQGIRLTAKWIRQPTLVETDCTTLIHALGKVADS